MNELVKLDQVDRELLQWLQDEFPMEKRPWAEGGKRLGISEEEVLFRVKRLSSDRKPFYASEKKTSVQEKSPGNQKEINDYKFYIKPVFEFELLDIDLY